MSHLPDVKNSMTTLGTLILYFPKKHAGLMIGGGGGGGGGGGDGGLRDALCCVLGEDTLLSQHLSPTRCTVNGYQLMNLMLRVTLRWTSIPLRGK